MWRSLSTAIKIVQEVEWRERKLRWVANPLIGLRPKMDWGLKKWYLLLSRQKDTAAGKLRFAVLTDWHVLLVGVVRLIRNRTYEDQPNPVNSQEFRQVWHQINCLTCAERLVFADVKEFGDAATFARFSREEKSRNRFFIPLADSCRGRWRSLAIIIDFEYQHLPPLVVRTRQLRHIKIVW